MENPHILHFFTPTKNASPFDVNMALDAGFDAVVPYTNVVLDDIVGLTQDAIFSRGPKGVKRTGIFLGGRELDLSTDMLEAARRAMVPPFEASVFADPSGAYTTAAAMVAAVEKALKPNVASLAGLKVVVFGGTGPVGACAAMLAAGAGARATVCSHVSVERAQAVATMCSTRYGQQVAAARAGDRDERRRLAADADVILATGKAGVQLLDRSDLAQAKSLLVAADVNAVPPEGIEGVGVMHNAVPLEAGSGRAVGIGALAIGNVKYKVQRGLFESMIRTEKPLYLDFRDAFARARELLA
ncbi:MAG TPA: NAD(P)-dependent methylenetetrahydromethanopterin dehydrogenase [Burkholderiaceae bacterium]|nr:NAD(P)-dependent methylenetetrahydromethanopterin dehydrogenase [Burkholderiaceae bacterium]